MSQLITDRNNYRAQLTNHAKGSTAYNKLIGDIGKKSEEIGELAGKNFLAKYFDEYTVVEVKMTGNGTGEFDIIAKHKTDDLYILVECKGGNSALNPRTTELGVTAMQGSRTYVDDITNGMKDWAEPPTNPDPAITYSDRAFVNKLGFDLEAALFDNKVEHFLVHQKLDVAGNTKITEISKFELND